MYAVIRVRGLIDIRPDIKKTMQLMRITRTNHCAILPETPSSKGMLQMVKDYTTWGEISPETLTKMLKTHGRLVGDKPLTEEYLASSTSFKTIEALSKALMDNSFVYKDIPEVKPLFRLHPPRKGYEGVKRSYQRGGALGYRGKDINALIERML